MQSPPHPVPRHPSPPLSVSTPPTTTKAVAAALSPAAEKQHMKHQLMQAFVAAVRGIVARIVQSDGPSEPKLFEVWTIFRSLTDTPEGVADIAQVFRHSAFTALPANESEEMMDHWHASWGATAAGITCSGRLKFVASVKAKVADVVAQHNADADADATLFSLVDELFADSPFRT